jgi:hypothetical protein
LAPPDTIGSVNRRTGLIRNVLAFIRRQVGLQVQAPKDAAQQIVGDLENVCYTGIDWSNDMMLQARDLHADLIESGRVQFLCGDSASLPFEAQCFEMVDLSRLRQR